MESPMHGAQHPWNVPVGLDEQFLDTLEGAHHKGRGHENRLFEISKLWYCDDWFCMKEGTVPFNWLSCRKLCAQPKK